MTMTAVPTLRYCRIFSDDSSILGVRKVLRCRVPYRGRAPLPRKGCAPAPRTPPVKAKNRAEQCLLEEDSTRSSWTSLVSGVPDALYARDVRTRYEGLY